MKITLYDNPAVFDAPSRGTPANICIYLISLATRITDLHFALIVFVYSHSTFFSGGLSKTTFFRKSALWQFKVIQGH